MLTVTWAMSLPVIIYIHHHQDSINSSNTNLTEYLFYRNVFYYVLNDFSVLTLLAEQKAEPTQTIPNPQPAEGASRG